MSLDAKGLRYEPSQVVEAVDRARGEGRWFLVRALSRLPIEQRELALSRVLDNQLGPDERHMALVELTRLRPERYLPLLIDTGLRSRSLDVQLMTVANLPELVDEGLQPDLGQQVERWLRRRVTNPRRARSGAVWEIPGVALALLPSYGTDRVVALLSEIEPSMLKGERNTWRSIKRAGDAQAVQQRLIAWLHQNVHRGSKPELRDPTAEVSVDAVMKRLGYRPANPDSLTYDSLADFEVPK